MIIVMRSVRMMTPEEVDRWKRRGRYAGLAGGRDWRWKGGAGVGEEVEFMMFAVCVFFGLLPAALWR